MENYQLETEHGILNFSFAFLSYKSLHQIVLDR